MRVIIVQGVSCLGKTSLCKELNSKLSNSVYKSVDDFKERYWDAWGFDSVKAREDLSNFAKKNYLMWLTHAIDCNNYSNILIDYVFHDEFWNQLLDVFKTHCSVVTKTIYLDTDDFEGHMHQCDLRSATRHAGHYASRYHNGLGEDCSYDYDKRVVKDLPTLGDTLTVNVTFSPVYSRNKTTEEILDFIQKC